MAFLEIKNVRIAGIAAAVPKDVKEIRDQPFFEDGEAEKVIDVTHIERSRIAREGLECSDLCFEAASRLVDELNWDINEIQALIYVSLSRDYPTPSTANILQSRLNLPKECLAFDIPFACSGYVYGLSVISSLMQTGNIKKALLLVGETTSRLQSSLDKTLWPLHGDGGSATALEFNHEAENMFFSLYSDGSRKEAIINRAGGTRRPFSESSLKLKKYGPGIARRDIDSEMDGMAVFNFAIKEPPKAVKELCEHFKLNLDDMDYFLIHQANQYIDEKVAKKLNIPMEKMPFSLSQYGNTSSATIPITAVACLRDTIQDKRVNTIMLGFGSGLSWGAAWISLDKLKLLPLIEVE